MMHVTLTADNKCIKDDAEDIISAGRSSASKQYFVHAELGRGMNQQLYVRPPPPVAAALFAAPKAAFVIQCAGRRERTAAGGYTMLRLRT